MSLFDRQPYLFRALAGLFLTVLIATASVTFYNYVSSPTDENWFRDVGSDLIFVSDVPATPVKANGDRRSDGILVGDVLLGVDDRKIKDDPEELQADIAAARPDHEFLFHILRPELNDEIQFTVRKTDLPDRFITKLQRFAYVFDVIEGGASDRAGMKVGDLIVSINGQTFRSANEADRILRRAQIGGTIDYEVYRKNQHLTLHVTLARFGIPIALLVFTLAGFVYMVIGGFIAVNRAQIKAARLIGLGLLELGFAMAVLTVRREADPGLFTYARDGAMALCFFLGLVTMFHSGFYFPRERPELVARRWIMVVPYVFVPVVLFLSREQGGAFLAAALLGFVLYFIGIRIAFRKHATEEYRRLNRVIRWTSGIVLVLTIAWILFVTGPMRFGYVGLALVLIPLAYLYTIGQYRLLDMNLRVRRNIQYTLVSAAWKLMLLVLGAFVFLAVPRIDLPLPNIVLTGSSIEITDTPLNPVQFELVQRVGFMVLALAVVSLLWTGGSWGQRLIDRKYYRQRYDYRRAAAELAEVMATKLTMVDLAHGLVEKMASLMQLKKAGVLFFRDEKACCCQEASGFNGKTWKEFCVVAEGELIAAIQRFQGEFRVDYLPTDIKDEFRRHEFQYLVPIRSKDHLVGTLLLGEKLSESTFQQEDFAFLSSVASQASVSIENAFLYEELAEKERMKHELEIARRIQLESLPQSTPVVQGLEIAGVSIPAMEVGGDFFDYLNGTPGKVTIIVGDVSGKGTSAALYMSKVQGILRSLHGFHLSPAQLFDHANRLLCQDLEKRSFVTILGAEFNAAQRTIQYARAGHLPLFYFNASGGEVHTITPKGLGLGLNAEGLFTAELKEETLTYHPGDILLFVTDGVTEAHRSDGDMFGEERIVAVLKAQAGLRADQIRDALLEEVRRFVGDAHQHDDQTVVVVKAG